MLDKYIDNDDPTKVRKSLLTVALLTVFFANIQFASNEMSILGLRVVIDPARLVALGRIASGTLCAIFVLRALPQIVKAFQDIAQRRLQRREASERLALMSHWDLDIPSAAEEGPEGEFEALDERFNHLRSRLEAHFHSMSLSASLIAVLSLDYAMPFAAGWIAASDPYQIADWITSLVPAVSVAPDTTAIPHGAPN